MNATPAPRPGAADTRRVEPGHSSDLATAGRGRRDTAAGALDTALTP